MSIFRVVFNGTNYNLRCEDGQPIGGFYVVVIVDSGDVDQACSLAYEKLIHSESYMASMGVNAHPNAVIEVSEVYELLERDPEEAEISGFIFYPPEDSDRTFRNGLVHASNPYR